MMRAGFVAFTLALVLLGFAGFQFLQVQPTVCTHIGKLIDVEQARVAVARDAKLREDYYLVHTGEAATFKARQNQSIADYDTARC